MTASVLALPDAGPRKPMHAESIRALALDVDRLAAVWGWDDVARMFARHLWPLVKETQR